MWNEIKRVDDSEERVAKFIFYSSDAVAESVLYRYPDYETRTVICCSTQSGCPIGCRFCGSGDYFVRNLTADEIVSQPEYLIQQTGVDPSKMGRLQLMFMSMGESMLNRKGLEEALIRLNEKYPNAELLVSSVGPSVDYDWFISLSKKINKIGLQFSIHESLDENRNKLIPFTKKLNLEQIAAVGLKWAEETGRKPFINYCAHESNSSQDDADRLASIFNPLSFNATVSVVCERSEGIEATNDFQRSLATEFASKMVGNGFDVRVFDPAGQDTIGGGCGQLHHTQKWMKSNPNFARPSIGNGKPIVHTPKLCF